MIQKQSIIDSYLIEDLTALEVGKKYHLSKKRVLFILKENNISVFDKKRKNIGKTFGRLEIKDVFTVKNITHAQCRCSCGNTVIINLSYVLSGNTKSCGCYKKDRMKEIHKNKKVSIETRKKQGIWRSNNFKGMDNPNWRGGISKETHLVRTSEKMDKWRIKIFKRDSFMCLKCDKIGGDLAAHHIFNFIKYPKRRFDMTNGVTFCKKCHIDFHKKNGFVNNDNIQLLKFIKKA